MKFDELLMAVGDWLLAIWAIWYILAEVFMTMEDTRERTLHKEKHD